MPSTRRTEDPDATLDPAASLDASLSEPETPEDTARESGERTRFEHEGDTLRESLRTTNRWGAFAPYTAVPEGRFALPRIWPSKAQLGADTPKKAHSSSPPPLPAAPPPASANSLVGKLIGGKYKVIEPLGRGGMGVVYRVEQRELAKPLAMKVLSADHARSPSRVRRFRREALMAARLTCTNTVQVVDFGVSDDLMYLVMELVDGQTVKEIVRRHGPLSRERLLRMGIQVCASLAEAHEKGIVHRDIKPDNVMLLRTSDGADVVKVLDFGLAKLRDRCGPLDVTSGSLLMGTPHYMSPEQIRSEDADERSDVYGVGALLYFAATGRPPFDGAPMDVLQKHLVETPIPPAVREPRADVSPSLSAIILRALEKEPEQRFAHIVELLEALKRELRALRASPPTAPRVGSGAVTSDDGPDIFVEDSEVELDSVVSISVDGEPTVARTKRANTVRAVAVVAFVLIALAVTAAIAALYRDPAEAHGSRFEKGGDTLSRQV
ncbi:MAG: serine/threonine-protein kinase [Polyangiaceae bacterium]